MHPSVDQLLAYVDVVDSGSISEAARRLGLAKSVVSKRLRDLEGVLKVQLLHRSTRKVTPTEAGLTLYDHAKQVLQALNAMEEVADTGRLRGRLRIAAPMTFGTLYLAPSLYRFLARHPDLELSLDLDDRYVDLTGYDLGVRIGRLKDSSLVARKLAESERVVVCSPAYAEAHGTPGTLAELKDHAIIGYANVTASEIWAFESRDQGQEPNAIVVRAKIAANNGEAMRDAAIAGFGIAILPMFIVADALRSGALIPLLPDERPVPSTVYAVYAPTAHVQRRVRAVIDHLREEFGGVPPWDRMLSDET